ncbi:MAG: hypothetical protein LC781_02005 [Actinobacteria bacterium]|nr:hypothetical protein [Actinomycetota bacterium]
MSVEYLESFEITPYFRDLVLGDLVRARLAPYIAETVNSFEYMETQEDGRVKHWRYIPELGHHLLVITTADGALFNAFDYSNFTRRQRRQG